MAKLKYTINDAAELDALDEPIRGLYEPIEESGGKSWRLSVEGATSKSKVDEFRDRNIELARERDRLSQETSKLMSPDQVQELANRLAQEKTRDLNEQLTRTLVEKHIAAIAGTAGVHPHALDDVLRRAHDVFKVAGDGKIVPRSATGDDLSNGSALLKPDEWINSLKSTHPHYWQTSSGGGASGQRDANGRFKSESKVRFKDDLKSAMEKSNYIREHGFAAFESLPLKNKPNPYQTWTQKQKKEDQR